jgi:hypothetical protein
VLFTVFTSRGALPTCARRWIEYLRFGLRSRNFLRELTLQEGSSCQVITAVRTFRQKQHSAGARTTGTRPNDADWNEQLEIQLYRTHMKEAQTSSASPGVPKENNGSK